MSKTPTGAILRIASRGSPLALAQSRLVREALACAHGWDPAALDEICPIVAVKTTGDRIQDRPLAEAGGKGLFTKEIEEALLAGAADIAVHSMKDVPSALPGGLEIAAVLERGDPRDVLIARGGVTLSALPTGARVGTSSVRREAQLRRARPDLEPVLLRGNVGTRLLKFATGDADAIILAKAGLARLSVATTHETLEGPNWLPALSQGVIGIEVRSGDTRARELVAKVDHPLTALTSLCERAFLAALDGSCRTPIAGLARVTDTQLSFEGEVLTPDGRASWQASRNASHASREDAAAMGRDAAQEIRACAGSELPIS